MNTVITISLEKNGTRTVSFDELPSHHVNETELNALLDTAQRVDWEFSKSAGMELGRQLYALLNGIGGKLSSILKEAFEKGETLHLCLDLPRGINALPFELICHEQQFIALMPKVHVLRRVTDRNKRREAKPEKRLLNIVFMACSPTESFGVHVLDFEKEEENIFHAVKDLPVDIHIEDSGSLKGLSEMLFKVKNCDVLHITGHAGVIDGIGPVFSMEDEFGNEERVTPEMLRDAVIDHPPQLLFLSGCETGKADNHAAVVSFAHEMVDAGIPFVLGWEWRVSDFYATELMTKLYNSLAKEKSTHEAVYAARKSFEAGYYPWNLLRLYSDGSPASPLVSPDHLAHVQYQRTTHRNLRGSWVTILEEGFIGRRKQVQQGVRALRGGSGKNGIIIRGPAGVGKSCLAGKLIERFNTHERNKSERATTKELIVFHGKLERPIIYKKLKVMFDQFGISSGLQTLASQEMTYEEKIKELFRTSFQEKPTLLFFDDFEQNLEQQGNGWVLKEEFKEIIAPFLEALDWAQGKTNLMITSRYPFILEVDGENLCSATLEDIPLISMRGSDLEKKTNSLEHIAKSRHKETYIEFGRGNPRLLEWLEKIAMSDPNDEIDIADLKDKLQGKNEEYILVYLAEIMAKTVSEEFTTFLHKAAVYRIPVPQSAFLSLWITDNQAETVIPVPLRAGRESYSIASNIPYALLLEQGVDLTLIEKEQAAGAEPQYWVAPVIREQQWEKLNSEEQQILHNAAYNWYDEQITRSKRIEIEYHREAIYHALASDRINEACKHGVVIGNYLSEALLYQDCLRVQLDIASRITLAVMEQAIQNKYKYVSLLLNNVGSIIGTLGDQKRAINYYENALLIDLKTYGENHPDVATSYNNLGAAYHTLGDAMKAIEYYEKALRINLKVYGESHPNVATRYSNLGTAYYTLGDAKKGIEYFEKALQIDLKVYGESHTSVATDYNNLGGAFYALGDYKKAIEYYTKGLQIDLKVYGESHPNVAIDYNNLGSIYDTLGDTKKGIKYFTKALQIDLNLYGGSHPAIARNYNNLGLAWKTLGDATKGIEYFSKALQIDLNVYGKSHPDVARIYNNLGGAYDTLGDAKKAIEYYEQALQIDLKVYGESHPDVARSYNNLGGAYDTLGDAKKAIEYYTKALEILRHYLGNDHPITKLTAANLAAAKKHPIKKQKKDNLKHAHISKSKKLTSYIKQITYKE